MELKTLTIGMEHEMLKLAPAAQPMFERFRLGRRTDRSIRDQNGRELPINGPSAGVELVTPVIPVSVHVTADGNNEKYEFEAAYRFVDVLTQCADKVNSSCGFHLHLGRPNGSQTTWNPHRLPNVNGGPMSEWKPSHIRTFLLIGLALENTVFSVVPESRKRSKHCRRIREVFSSTELQAYYPINNLKPRKYANPQRYCWLNLIETRRPADPEEERVGYSRSQAYGTVEVRALGETNNPSYIKTWIAMWLKIAAAVAYLPSELAVMRCQWSGWLQPEIDALRHHRQTHETCDAISNRSALPTEETVIQYDE